MADYVSQFTGAEIDSRLRKAGTAVQPADLESKQDTLVSGENIKTVNGQSIVGSGNIQIQAGDTDAVKYVEQTLTDAQKEQARTNIAAASAAELGQIVTDLTGIEADIDSLEAAVQAIGVGDFVTATALPTASASTMGHIYLIGPDANNNYDRYFTQESGGAYSWVPLGSTQIDLSTYATQEEVSQLRQEVTADVSQLEAKVDDLSTGKYYGYFAQEEDLPETDVDGFAYVGEGPTYTIYNCEGGVWTSSGITVNQSPVGNDEDIDQNGDGKLQFANRVYNAQQPNGMGYKILRKNATFASQVTDTNTIYEIRYDFVLTGNVSIPANCTLKFVGGSIGGAFQLTCNNTGILAGMVQIFGAELTLSGSYSITEFFPEWFGAKGDGNTDDTDSIRKALYTVNNHPVSLVFNSYKKYRVSGSLNYFNNSYFSVNAIIRSNAPKALKPDDCGILLVDKNESIFKSATISGEICGVNFLCVTTSHTTDASSMFYRCRLSGLLFDNCRVSQFNSFLAGGAITSISKITGNYIWAFYFAKTLTVDGNIYRCSLMDSTIKNNRILGQSDSASDYQNVDNVCFEFRTYAGSYIMGNFVDYFRIIFNPGDIGCNGNINSLGNHYQVFRYFYKNIGATDSSSAGSLNSIGDAFNWTKEENGQEEILDRYTKDTYVGTDGVTYIIPTYILLIRNKEHIKIIDCILEGMLGNIVFIENAITSDDTEIKFTCNVSGVYFSEHSGKIPVARLEGNPTNRNFLLSTTNLFKISLPKYCMDTVNSLVLPAYQSQGVPTPGNYSKYLVGEKVIYNGSIYELEYLQRSNNSRFDWVKGNALPINVLDANKDIVFNSINAASYDLAFKFTIVFVKATASYNTVTSITIPDELRNIPLTIYNDGTLDVILSPVIVNGKAVVLKPKKSIVINRPSFTSTITCLANSSEISHSGTFANRPTGTDVYVGYQYFCTDRQTAEGAVDGITLTHKGSDVWVDALGRVVS